MNKKNEVGSLIYNGYTSEQIRERIPSFPQDPNKEYFLNLGYSVHTASNYITALNKNNHSSIKKIFSIEGFSTFTSKNANVKDLILDCSAFDYEELVKLVLDSYRVTVLYSVIKNFAATNQECLISMLQNTHHQYRLVPWKWKSTTDADEAVFDYLENLPSDERPTLLTANQNMALRAKCLGFDYILYIKQKSE